MPWKPGESGNLRGRPMLTDEQRRAIDKAKKLTPWSIDQLAELATIERNDQGKITNGFLALQAHLALLKVGGIAESESARVEEFARAIVSQMLEDARAKASVSESEPDNEPKALEPVK